MKPQPFSQAVQALRGASWIWMNKRQILVSTSTLTMLPNWILKMLDLRPSYGLKKAEKEDASTRSRKETIVGRKAADLVLDDPKVSSTHAKIVVENGQYILIDFHSKNGTYVNGERIRAETPLKEMT